MFAFCARPGKAFLYWLNAIISPAASYFLSFRLMSFLGSQISLRCAFSGISRTAVHLRWHNTGEKNIARASGVNTIKIISLKADLVNSALHKIEPEFAQQIRETLANEK